MSWQVCIAVWQECRTIPMHTKLFCVYYQWEETNKMFIFTDHRINYLLYQWICIFEIYILSKFIVFPRRLLIVFAMISIVKALVFLTKSLSKWFLKIPWSIRICWETLWSLVLESSSFMNWLTVALFILTSIFENICSRYF